MGIPSGWELIILLGVLVLLFGAAKLPTAARSIGQSIRIFKAETKGARSEEEQEASAPTPPQPALPPPDPTATASHQPGVSAPRAAEEPQRHHDTTH